MQKTSVHVAAAGGATSSATPPLARLRSVDPPLLARAWRTALRTARATGRGILGRNDADLDDVAAEAARRTLIAAALPFPHTAMVETDGLARPAALMARRLARDLIRTRHGRRRDSPRRVDPLQRADTVALAEEGITPPALRVASAEELLLAREEQRQIEDIWQAAGRLPRAQREAIAARLAGHRPLSPARRQALRAALVALRRSVTADPWHDSREMGA